MGRGGQRGLYWGSLTRGVSDASIGNRPYVFARRVRPHGEGAHMINPDARSVALVVGMLDDGCFASRDQERRGERRERKVKQ
jgi:hypothetical protein